MGTSYETKYLPKDYDYKAPDPSEIRLLPRMKGGSLAHCTLRPGHTSSPVFHNTIEEIWYFIEGDGLFARRVGDASHWDVVEVKPDSCITIPAGVQFQFRNTGDVPLKAVIVSMPPWPGKDEAVALATGHWRTGDETELPLNSNK